MPETVRVVPGSGFRYGKKRLPGILIGISRNSPGGRRCARVRILDRAGTLDMDKEATPLVADERVF
jgi:hypothetical protein